MSWVQITLESDPEGAGLLSELLEQFGAVSISLSPASPEPVFNTHPDGQDLLWEKTRVQALLDEDTNLDILLASLRNRVGTERIKQCTIGQLADKNWLEEYKQQGKPVLFADRLCICPGWCEPPADSEYVLHLDPGLAFGTGTHETTGLCLEWLAKYPLAGKTVIDYGCGSGILGISCLLLGASHVYALDIDEQALLATRANSEKNGFQEQISIGTPGQLQPPAADVLVANILLQTLVELAPTFVGLVHTGGRIVLSGILATQVEECLDAFQSWFTMDSPAYNREWALLTGSRRTTAIG